MRAMIRRKEEDRVVHQIVRGNSGKHPSHGPVHLSNLISEDAVLRGVCERGVGEHRDVALRERHVVPFNATLYGAWCMVHG